MHGPAEVALGCGDHDRFVIKGKGSELSKKDVVSSRRNMQMAFMVGRMRFITSFSAWARLAFASTSNLLRSRDQMDAGRQQVAIRLFHFPGHLLHVSRLWGFFSHSHAVRKPSRRRAWEIRSHSSPSE
jgi:hypothetical protein